MSALPAIDPLVLEELSEMMGEDGPAVVEELIDAYLEDTPQRLSEIARALAKGDGDSIRRQAHAMKSASATVGAKAVASSAAELEHHRGDHRTMGPGIDRLFADYTAAADELTSLRAAIAA